jgi:hypothetical protein
MGDTDPGTSSGAARRGKPGKIGSSVLTPPVGLPAVPSQRKANDTPAAPPVAPQAPPQVVVDPCVCGHANEAHEHYRIGSDCGACGAQNCAEFRREGGSFRKMMRRLGLTP